MLPEKKPLLFLARTIMKTPFFPFPDPRGHPTTGRRRLDQRDHPWRPPLLRLQPPAELRGDRPQAGRGVRVSGPGQEQVRVERGDKDIPLLLGEER